MISYSQIIKQKNDTSNTTTANTTNTANTTINNNNTQKSDTIVSGNSNNNKNNTRPTYKLKNSRIRNKNKYKYNSDNVLKQKIIKPLVKKVYCRQATVQWLYTKIDNNYFHYDYCVKLFRMFLQWVHINKFNITISEDILLAKFISLMYLLSNKQDYVS